MLFLLLYHHLFTLCYPICYTCFKLAPNYKQPNLARSTWNDSSFQRLNLKEVNMCGADDQWRRCYVRDSTVDPALMPLEKGFVWCHHLLVLLLLDLSQCLWDSPWWRACDGSEVNTTCTLHFNGTPFPNIDLVLNHRFIIISILLLDTCQVSMPCSSLRKISQVSMLLKKKLVRFDLPI